MLQYVQYINRAQGLRSGFGTLPAPARLLVMIAALPGIALAVLSMLLLGVSIIALLLLTVPTYRLLRLVFGSGVGEQQEEVTVQTVNDAQVTGRRQIDAKVIE